MAHQALYREWRPKVFDEVVEQKHAVYALRQAVISGQIGHAYLFSGTRGTGKTTLAKIFARAINCLDPHDGNPCNQCTICRGMLDGSLLDIVEMDAASNNSVDNIRRICDEVVFMPSQARYKVYIIDEVHMLSTGAFNALLKTLEEPPAHAVFILATTEPHRIPATILSRCQRYEFRRIPVTGLVGRLAEIAASDGIDISEDALQAIASLADGAMRDAISLLDQAKASFPARIERDDVLGLAGVVQDEFMQRMAEALINGDAPALLELVDQLVMAGRDMARFVTDLAQHLRNILVCQVSANPHLLVRAASDTLAGMRQLAGQISSEQVIELIKGLSALLSDLRWAADARTALEIGLIRLMAGRTEIQAGDRSKIAPKPDGSVFHASAVIETKVFRADDKTAPVKVATKHSPAVTPVETDGDPGPLPPPADDDLPADDITPVSSPESLALTSSDPEVSLSETSDEPKADSEPVLQSAEPSAAVPDVAKSWPAILDHLLNEGHMTLYLFCRPIRPQIIGNKLQLHFAPTDHVNFQEVSQAGNIKILRAAATRLAGHDVAVQTILDSSQNNTVKAATAEPAPENWIDKMKKTADTLGIPLKVEE